MKDLLDQGMRRNIFEEPEEEEEDRRLSTSSMLSEKTTPPHADRKESMATASAARPGGGVPPSSREVRDPSRQCRCKKSKCIRQYCVCFRYYSSFCTRRLVSKIVCRAAELCRGCECVECLNDGLHEMVSAILYNESCPTF